MYYIEEEIEEEGEEEVEDVDHHRGVEVIPEADSGSELTQSPDKYSKRKSTNNMRTMLDMSPPPDATFNRNSSGPGQQNLTSSRKGRSGQSGKSPPSDQLVSRSGDKGSFKGEQTERS